MEKKISILVLILFVIVVGQDRLSAKPYSIEKENDTQYLVFENLRVPVKPSEYRVSVVNEDEIIVDLLKKKTMSYTINHKEIESTTNTYTQRNMYNILNKYQSHYIKSMSESFEEINGISWKKSLYLVKKDTLSYYVWIYETAFDSEYYTIRFETFDYNYEKDRDDVYQIMNDIVIDES